MRAGLAKQSPRRAVIVSHGQPSDPAPAEADLAVLAQAVEACLPGWQVGSATLANPDAFVRAVKGGPGLIYPLFMSGGWFTATHLPDRLAAAGAADWQILAPFGLDPGVQSLTVALAKEACLGRLSPEVLLAAHGSFRSPAPSEVAYDMLRQLRAAGITKAEAGFIDQSPRIADIAKGFGSGAVCLPFFAAKGGHVVDDLPAALAAGNFSGRLLPPVGLDPRVPGLIAMALRAGGRHAPTAEVL
jgi:sirohydrochlorin ferrochelatase